MTEPLSPGEPRQIAGYRLRERLGVGGMGAVYLSSTPGGHPVALKVIRSEFADDPEFRRRFTREVAAARRVQGPYTAAVIDSDTDGDPLWLASSYVAGPSLALALRQHGPLPETGVLTLAAGIAEALQSIHAAGITHRDLKPSNVLLASDGPRVIDFGIARATDATAMTGTGAHLGTPAYMSPEQADGHPEGPAVDVFALGLIMFHAATGRHPFGEGSGLPMLYRIIHQEPDLTGCPAALRPLVERCLAKDPGRRPDPGTVVAQCRHIAAAHGADLSRAEGWWQSGPPAGPAPDAAQQPTGQSPAPAPPAPIPPSQAPNAPHAPHAPYGAFPTQPSAPSAPAGYPAGPPPQYAPPAAGAGTRQDRRGGPRTRQWAWAVGAVAACAALALVAANLFHHGAKPAAHGTPSATSATSAGSGAGPDGKAVSVRIGSLDWAESVATAALWQVVLERRGYRVDNRATSSPNEVFAAVNAGQSNFFTGAWLPDTHAQYMKQYSTDLTDLGRWSDNAPLQIVVPSYVKGVKTLADLKGRAKTFGGKIIGIEPGARETQLLKNKVLPGYGLAGEYTLQSTSTAAMLTALRTAYTQHRPVAVALWEPHWAHSRYDLTGLADPKGLWGRPESLHTVANRKFAAGHPRVATWLRDFHLSMKQLDSIEDAIDEAGPDHVQKAVQHWVAQHPGIVDEMAPVHG